MNDSDDAKERRRIEMALKVPEAFLTKDETKKYALLPAAEERLYRLPANHVADLRDVARGVEESDAGVCCSYLVDSMSGEGADFDEHALNALERFAEQSMTFDFLSATFGVPVVSNWRARIQRCRRAVALLHEGGDHRSVSVLFVAYGYPDPVVRQLPDLTELGPAASLVKYTDATEEKRKELVRLDVRGRDGAGVIDLGRRRERLEFADRSIGSGDALAFALAAFPEPAPVPRPGESVAEHEAKKAARKERERLFREKRAAYLTAARIESLKMLSAAEKAYHAAWLKSALPGRGSYGRGNYSGEIRKREPVLPPARTRGAGWSST